MTEKVSICATESLTILSWEHNGNGAERSLAFGVVGTHFDAKWRKGQDALVPVHVTGLSRYGGDGLCPVDLSQRPQSDDVAETISVLQVFGHRLGGKQKTIVILKHTDQIRPRVHTQCLSKSHTVSANLSRAQMNRFLIYNQIWIECHYGSKGPRWKTGLALTEVINTSIQFHLISQNYYLAQREW